MRIVTTRAATDAHLAAQCMNRIGLAAYVLNINDSGVVVLRFTEYAPYVAACKALGQGFVQLKEF